jgi:hypothetical protein
LTFLELIFSLKISATKARWIRKSEREKTRRKAVKRENETPESRVLAVTPLERGRGENGKNLFWWKKRRTVE